LIHRVKRELVLRRSARACCSGVPTIHSMRRLFVLACLSFIQMMDAPPAGADAPSEFAKCAGMVNATERLKCYDAAADRQGFGLPPPPRDPVTKPEGFGKPPPAREAEVKEISATVAEFSRTPRGRAIFVLDNGQVWRQIDGDTAEVRDPAAGRAMRVMIESGALGSYNLVIEGRTGSIKVRRLR
jgi:hypothetical protein